MLSSIHVHCAVICGHTTGGIEHVPGKSVISLPEGVLGMVIKVCRIGHTQGVLDVRTWALACVLRHIIERILVLAMIVQICAGGQ
ncbi:MAG: hypothetical protein GX043_09435, partial [Desulfovibrionales bacterium]|nr:hypothetical protein [Desulfovibrionales bacterium]